MSSQNGINKEANNKNCELLVGRRKTSQNNTLIDSIKGFRGFNVLPRVLVTRYDITPYLCKLHKRKKLGKSKLKELLEKSVHSRRLRQKCAVTVINQDLVKLKNELSSQRNRKNSLDSTSSAENDVTNTISCKLCGKYYVSENRLDKHLEKKHSVNKSQNKTPKRVSFSDHVIIHEVKEYHKCKKCADIFEDYSLLKRHIKATHKKHATKNLENKNINNINSNEVIIAIDDDDTPEQTTVEPKQIEELTDSTTVTEETVDESKETKILQQTGIVRQKPRKTIISQHQCQACGKYLSSKYCLRRHVETVHQQYNNLQCKMCEEVFVWPSLLQSHKCIRFKIPEMPFQDSRPEIHFDNLIQVSQNGYNNCNYMNGIDIEIPEPIVDLTESNEIIQNQDRFAPLCNLGYKIITQQEVPIEF